MYPVYTLGFFKPIFCQNKEVTNEFNYLFQTPTLQTNNKKLKVVMGTTTLFITVPRDTHGMCRCSRVDQLFIR